MRCATHRHTVRLPVPAAPSSSTLTRAPSCAARGESAACTRSTYRAYTLPGRVSAESPAGHSGVSTASRSQPRTSATRRRSTPACTMRVSRASTQQPKASSPPAAASVWYQSRRAAASSGIASRTVPGSTSGGSTSATAKNTGASRNAGPGAPGNRAAATSSESGSVGAPCRSRSTCANRARPAATRTANTSPRRHTRGRCSKCARSASRHSASYARSVLTGAATRATRSVSATGTSGGRAASGACAPPRAASWAPVGSARSDSCTLRAGSKCSARNRFCSSTGGTRAASGAPDGAPNTRTSRGRSSPYTSASAQSPWNAASRASPASLSSTALSSSTYRAACSTPGCTSASRACQCAIAARTGSGSDSGSAANAHGSAGSTPCSRKRASIAAGAGSAGAGSASGARASPSTNTCVVPQSTTPCATGSLITTRTDRSPSRSSSYSPPWPSTSPCSARWSASWRCATCAKRACATAMYTAESGTGCTGATATWASSSPAPSCAASAALGRNTAYAPGASATESSISGDATSAQHTRAPARRLAPGTHGTSCTPSGRALTSPARSASESAALTYTQFPRTRARGSAYARAAHTHRGSGSGMLASQLRRPARTGERGQCGARDATCAFAAACGARRRLHAGCRP